MLENTAAVPARCPEKAALPNRAPLSYCWEVTKISSEEHPPISLRNKLQKCRALVMGYNLISKLEDEIAQISPFRKGNAKRTRFDLQMRLGSFTRGGPPNTSCFSSYSRFRLWKHVV